MEKMDNNVESILDMMTELLDSAWSIPLSGGKSAIEAERFHEMIQVKGLAQSKCSINIKHYY